MQAQFAYQQPQPRPVDQARVYSFFANATIFRKTIAGHQEFEQRAMPLRAELRRLLILIDGHHTTDSLRPCVRPGELPRLLAELQALGLVESTATKPAFDHTAVARIANKLSALSPARFDAVRAAAMQAAQELLGAAAQSYRLSLVLCRDMSKLREILAELDTQITASLGDDGSTVFFESIRDAAEYLHAA
jgi:hypothetical protein